MLASSLAYAIVAVEAAACATNTIEAQCYLNTTCIWDRVESSCSEIATDCELRLTTTECIRGGLCVINPYTGLCTYRNTTALYTAECAAHNPPAAVLLNETHIRACLADARCDWLPEYAQCVPAVRTVCALSTNSTCIGTAGCKSNGTHCVPEVARVSTARYEADALAYLCGFSTNTTFLWPCDPDTDLACQQRCDTALCDYNRIDSLTLGACDVQRELRCGAMNNTSAAQCEQFSACFAPDNSTCSPRVYTDANPLYWEPCPIAVSIAAGTVTVALPSHPVLNLTNNVRFGASHTLLTYVNDSAAALEGSTYYSATYTLPANWTWNTTTSDWLLQINNRALWVGYSVWVTEPPSSAAEWHLFSQSSESLAAFQVIGLTTHNTKWTVNRDTTRDAKRPIRCVYPGTAPLDTSYEWTQQTELQCKQLDVVIHYSRSTGAAALADAGWSSQLQILYTDDDAHRWSGRIHELQPNTDRYITIPHTSTLLWGQRAWVYAIDAKTITPRTRLPLTVDSQEDAKMLHGVSDPGRLGFCSLNDLDLLYPASQLNEIGELIVDLIMGEDTSGVNFTASANAIVIDTTDIFFRLFLWIGAGFFDDDASTGTYFTLVFPVTCPASVLETDPHCRALLRHYHFHYSPSYRDALIELGGDNLAVGTLSIAWWIIAYLCAAFAIGFMWLLLTKQSPFLYLLDEPTASDAEQVIKTEALEEQQPTPVVNGAPTPSRGVYSLNRSDLTGIRKRFTPRFLLDDSLLGTSTMQ